jgi:L-fuconolactonase
MAAAPRTIDTVASHRCILSLCSLPAHTTWACKLRQARQEVMIGPKQAPLSDERNITAVNRRTFLGISAGIAAMDVSAQAASIPIIDTHMHLFDTRRPQGVPWPEKKDTILYRPALPDRYRKIVAPLGVMGAIEIEASPLLEDNQWVLDQQAKDTIFVGTVGDLEPGKPDFRKNLERFHHNPLFLGIRYGNIWGRDLGKELSKPRFVADLKELANAGLELDTADPDPALISAVVHLTDKVPNLRVVIDHLPQLEPPTASAALHAYQADLRELGKRSQVYVKISEVFRRVDGKVPLDLNFYRPRLDELWGIFGDDRLMYGSDWPNCDIWSPYSQMLSLVRQYVTAKGPAVAEKFFWKNSVAAYRWARRGPNQPEPKRI